MKSLSLLAALAAATLLAAPAESAEPRCAAPVDGLASLLEKPRLRFLLLGEIHGTAETPALFSDIICLASSRPLVVASNGPPTANRLSTRFFWRPMKRPRGPGFTPRRHYAAPMAAAAGR